jgi:hypothetical protein
VPLRDGARQAGGRGPGRRSPDVGGGATTLPGQPLEGLPGLPHASRPHRFAPPEPDRPPHPNPGQDRNGRGWRPADGRAMMGANSGGAVGKRMTAGDSDPRRKMDRRSGKKAGRMGVPLTGRCRFHILYIKDTHCIVRAGGPWLVTFSNSRNEPPRFFSSAGLQIDEAHSPHICRKYLGPRSLSQVGFSLSDA